MGNCKRCFKYSIFKKKHKVSILMLFQEKLVLLNVKEMEFSWDQVNLNKSKF